VAKQLFYNWSHGKDVVRLKAVAGDEGLSELDQYTVDFMEAFTKRFISQGMFFCLSKSALFNNAFSLS